MEIEQELARINPQAETLLTIGVFDGVHAGHRYLLARLKQRATEIGLLSGVVTFNPHPQSVLHPDRQLPWLTSLEDRIKALRDLGVDTVAVLTFNHEVAMLGARDFLSLLKKYIKMRGIVVGPDFTLGRAGEGNINLLNALGDEMKFTVEVIPPHTIDGEIVSSTLIRQALIHGDMRRVEKLMGRHFYLAGKVVTSDKRGRALGFPTANLEIRRQQALPEYGVYATITQVDGKRFLSATNIGTRPTFGEGKKLVETHLLNYQGSLYDKNIRVEFVQKLRDEKCFASPEELKTQIKKDIRKVEALLGKDLR
jgi:riboflavin kinase / FMN adenylyltransferase